MRKVLALIVFSTLFVSVTNAQSCLDKYRKAFIERGSEEIVDSTYEDVIISVKEGNTVNCYLGMVTVRHKKVLVDNFFIKLEDGNYDNWGPRLKTVSPVEISNGISRTIYDKKETGYNVIFISHIKPKKSGFMRAPDFDLD